MIKHLFASYSRHDKEVVRILCAFLRISGSEVFRDEESIAPGKLWKAELEVAVAAADCVLVFWSKNSSKSLAVRQEYEQAISLGKEVAPLLLDNTPIAETLSKYQCFDLRDVIATRHAFEIPMPRQQGPEVKSSLLQNLLLLISLLRQNSASKVDPEPRQGNEYLVLVDVSAEVQASLQRKFNARIALAGDA